jgi:hypothetical protein
LVAPAMQAAQNGDYTPIQASATPLPGRVCRELITNPPPFINALTQLG